MVGRNLVVGIKVWSTMRRSQGVGKPFVKRKVYHVSQVFAYKKLDVAKYNGVDLHCDSAGISPAHLGV